MRPEVTPSLARLAAARQRQYKKPLKWFQIGSCFRYEEPQEGRTREFIQFNADILGDTSPGADAELIALAIDTMLEFGFSAEDFAIRLSNREIWNTFLTNYCIPSEQIGPFLQIIDKIERAKPEETAKKLAAIGLSVGEVRSFMNHANADHPAFADLRANLTVRGLWQHVRIDASIVRGLAYYTGTVFEVFDLKHNLRAIAGGGRYDRLINLISNGKTDMSAAGFAMGDVVLGILLDKTPGSQFKLTSAVQDALAIDAALIIAGEAQRPHALAALQTLRARNLRIDYAFAPASVEKQLQAAKNRKARYAIVFGAEYPQLTLKDLVARTQEEIPAHTLADTLTQRLAQPPTGPLLA
jgi:histidyl-tRNA synthetase